MSDGAVATWGVGIGLTIITLASWMVRIHNQITEHNNAHEMTNRRLDKLEIQDAELFRQLEPIRTELVRLGQQVKDGFYNLGQSLESLRREKHEQDSSLR